MCSDDFLPATREELSLSSDEDVELDSAQISKTHKGEKRVTFMCPPGFDDDSTSDEDDRITMGNMEARSRTLDEQAAHEGMLDLAEMQNANGEDDEDVDMLTDGGEEEGEPFRLPTAEEREEEKQNVADVQTVQKRMWHCVRVLGNLKKLAEKGRYVSIAVW